MENVSASVYGGGKILSFGAELAIVIGLNEAIFLHRLAQILAEEPCLHGAGRKWACRSVADWQGEEFPFWSESTIKRTIRSLVQQAARVKGTPFFPGRMAYTIDYDQLEAFCGSVAYRSLVHG